MELLQEHMRHDLETVKTSIGRISECPEEVECFIKLLGYLYATTQSHQHRKIIAWCLHEMSYRESLQEEVHQWIDRNRNHHNGTDSASF